MSSCDARAKPFGGFIVETMVPFVYSAPLIGMVRDASASLIMHVGEKETKTTEINSKRTIIIESDFFTAPFSSGSACVVFFCKQQP